MNLRNIKRWILVGALSLSLLGGCQKATKGSEEFQAYADSFPAILTEHISFDLNFLFEHPETYGIEKDIYTLDFISLEDYKSTMEKLEDKFAELDEYDYDQLNEDQKIVYRLMEYNAEDTGIDSETMYYLTTNYFDTNSGIQAQLPMTLWNYEFKNQKSVDSFLAVLKDAQSIFPKYVELEKIRQEKGFGISETYRKDVLDALHTINTTDQTYILDATNQKIDAVDFLNDAEKESYKAQIKTAFDEQFLPAFLACETALREMSIVKTGEGELASYPSGKEYYENIVCENAGVDTMKEYEKFLEEEEKNIIARLQDLMASYPELSKYFMDTDLLMEAFQNTEYTKSTTSLEVIETLEEAIANGEDFPKIKKLHYEMNQFPESMKDTTLAAAAYFLSAYDDTSGQDEHMILNGTFKQEDFTTIAHESFPGHMYQHNYFKTVEHHILRDLFSSNAYSEGWAKYIEGEVCDLSLDPAMCHLIDINNQLTYLTFLQLDKQIHYDGISRDDAYQFMKENFGVESEEDLAQQYEQLLENPGIFSTYYASCYRLLGLKDQAKEAWGSEYSDLRFHEMILNLGPLPMKLLMEEANL